MSVIVDVCRLIRPIPLDRFWLTQIAFIVLSQKKRGIFSGCRLYNMCFTTYNHYRIYHISVRVRRALQEFEIVFYESENGEKPVEIFLDSLNPKMRAKMLRSILIIKEYGYQTRMPYSEELEDGIFELRAKVGSDISRVLYFFMVGRKVILTNGFIKKTQKTPREEIE